MNASRKLAQHPGQTPAIASDAQPTAAPSLLLTPQQLAALLSVPVSWIREKTRERARLRDRDPLPTIRLGKYVRFSRPAVEAWIARQGT